MTADGTLFITENVRDAIESKHRDLIYALAANDLHIQVAERGSEFTGETDPVDYPETGNAVIYTRDEGTESAQSVILGTAAFTITRSVESTSAGNCLAAHVATVAVAWRWDGLANCGVDTSQHTRPEEAV